MKVIIELEVLEKPTVHDVLDYIQELGEDLHFYIEEEEDE